MRQRKHAQNRRLLLKCLLLGVPITSLLVLKQHLARRNNTMATDSSQGALPSFQYELVPTSRDTALESCIQLRQEGKGSFTPILLDSPEKYQLDGSQLEALKAELPGILASAKSISVDEFFRQQREGNQELYVELEKGTWPARPQAIQPRIMDNVDKAYIVKVPTSRSYEAVAHIGFGGWNDCPEDAQHVAIQPALEPTVRGESGSRGSGLP